MISVIMPCFNTSQEIYLLTQQAIESIKQNEVELIIIDNGSTFAPGYLKQQADVYLKNQFNHGYPYAVNQGIVAAKGDILAIANNDIRVPKNIFFVGESVLLDPKVGSVHFKMLPYNEPFTYGDKVWLTGRERWCTSSFFMIKREAAIFYDEQYEFGGYDDWDYWHQVRHLNGWMTAYTNRSCYQHWGSWTLSQIPENLKSTNNREYFKSKFGHYPEDIWQLKYPDQMKANYLEGFL